MEKITHDNWPERWADVPAFTEVSKEVYNDMLDALPPVYLRHSPYCGFQMGEPQDHAEDETGKWRARFLTFVHVGRRYYYAGINFGGECIQCMPEEGGTVNG
jgi:hypothetical protein